MSGADLASEVIVGLQPTTSLNAYGFATPGSNNLSDCKINMVLRMPQLL